MITAASLPTTISLWLIRQSGEVIELDLDATDDPVHGHQLGRFFHGYYDEYCFLDLPKDCVRWVKSGTDGLTRSKFPEN